MSNSNKTDCYSDHPNLANKSPEEDASSARVNSPGPPGSGQCLNYLLDGSDTGAVRGIGTKNDYIMGEYAVALGLSTAASGKQSVAEGEQTVASGCNSHAEGFRTAATAQYAHVEGYDSFAAGGAAHAENCGNTASGTCSHAEGAGSTASGEGAHAEGASTASQIFSHSEGFRTESAGVAAHAEGNEAKSTGYCAHAEGSAVVASGEASHAEGASCISSGYASHAEGERTTASRISAHAEGFDTAAGGIASHSEGAHSVASGVCGHAEGIGANASGGAAHAQGLRTTAAGSYSHAEGCETSTNGFDGAHIMGRYGSADAEYSWFLANGANAENTGLAAKILGTGDAYIDHAWNGGGTGFAELFETEDGKEIELGLFVTFAGRTDKIRTAGRRDRYILGVVSAEAAFVCNSGALRWNGKYKTDEWGRVLYEEATVPSVTEQEGRVVLPERREMRPVLNPTWDPAQPYIPRTGRQEWATVVLVGTVRVRDEGTCVPGGYCLAGAGGIAVPTARGHRVLRRTGRRQIQILMR